MSPIDVMDIAEEVEHFGSLTSYIKLNNLNIELQKSPNAMPALRSTRSAPSFEQLNTPYGSLLDFN